MAEKKVNKARIIMKHDTEENWLKATNFIPLDSEIIVYDADATNTIPRIKVGDGVTNVNALPFITEELENKVDKVEGKGLSTNDYTDEEAAKVAAAASLNIMNGTHLGSVKTSMATEASAYYSFAEGQNTTASGSASHSEGQRTTASGLASHAEGQGTTASGNDSHSEGQGTTASGKFSHAEGRGTTASGLASHAEGNNTKASGQYSHAEGQNTTASGSASHAEGQGTTASGLASHAGGDNTIVKGACGTAIGKYNLDPDSGENILVTQLNVSHSFKDATSYLTTYTQPTISVENGTVTYTNTSYLTPDKFQAELYVINTTENEPGYFKILSTPVLNDSYYDALVDSYLITLASATLSTYAFSIGNGTSDSNRSNAYTLDWDGTAWFQGNVLVGGTGQDDTNAKQLATQEYVDTALSNAGTQSDWSINDENNPAYVKNRTHYSEGVSSAVLEKSFSEPTQQVEGRNIFILGEINIYEGEEYTINYNGTTYTTTAYLDSLNQLIIGRSDDGDNPDIPFRIFCQTPPHTSELVSLDLATSLTISITGPDLSIVHKLSPKYLPITYSTVDLEAGVSPLAEGEIYFVYE